MHNMMVKAHLQADKLEHASSNSTLNMLPGVTNDENSI